MLEESRRTQRRFKYVEEKDLISDNSSQLPHHILSALQSDFMRKIQDLQIDPARFTCLVREESIRFRARKKGKDHRHLLAVWDSGWRKEETQGTLQVRYWYTRQEIDQMWIDVCAWNSYR